MTIKEIHNNTFNHLRERYPDIYFTLRKIDKGGRLRNGYWFLGNDDILSFSFWKGNDPFHRTPNICYSIKLDGSALLEFVDWRDPKDTIETKAEKRIFFEKIAKTFKMTALKSKNGAVNKWIRKEPNTDYLKTLDDFIQSDKLLLDTLISVSEVKDLLAPISKEEFEKALQVIGKFKARPIAPIPVASAKPLRLETLKLTNISHFDTVEIDFHPRLTCLIGENGSGKTTILRAITFGLVGYSNENFIRDGIEELDNKLNNFLKIKKAQNQRIDYESNGYIELTYNENKINKIEFRLLPEGVNEQGKLRAAGAIDKDDSASDFETLDASKNFKNLVLGFSQNKNYKGEPPHDTHQASISGIYNLLVNEADFSFKSVQQWICQTFSLDIGPEKRIEMVKVLKKAFEIMSDITGVPLELGQMSPQLEAMPLVKTADAPNGIPLNLVSQGYENLIGWVGYFVKRMYEVLPMDEDFTQKPAICLIDEIDTYLHPKWQSRILNVLVTNFPKVQFIVTTHSPYVVGSIPKGWMKLYICKPQVEEFTEFTPYGANIQRLTDKIFGTPVRFETVATKVMQLRTDIQNNEFEKADQLLQQLEELGVGDDDNDPEIGSLKILLRTKKRKASA